MTHFTKMISGIIDKYYSFTHRKKKTKNEEYESNSKLSKTIIFKNNKQNNIKSMYEFDAKLYGILTIYSVR